MSKRKIADFKVGDKLKCYSRGLPTYCIVIKIKFQNALCKVFHKVFHDDDFVTEKDIDIGQLNRWNKGE